MVLDDEIDNEIIIESEIVKSDWEIYKNRGLNATIERLDAQNILPTHIDGKEVNPCKKILETKHIIERRIIKRYPSILIHYDLRREVDEEVNEYAVFSRMMGEWVVFQTRRWNESGMKYEEECTGPYKSDDYTAQKILETYKIPEGKISCKDVLSTPPSELEKIAKILK